MVYLLCVVIAVVAALLPKDSLRRSDARKVLSLLLSVLTRGKHREP
jgi:hypothetical protein